MPRVPRADEQVREVGLPGARLNVEAPLEAFGGGQGPANVASEGRAALSDITKYAAEERRQADELVVQQADLETAQEKLRLLKDPKTGALSRRGQETMGLPDEVGPAFDKFTSDVQKRLTPSQRAAYNRLSMGHKRDINDQLQNHIFSEMAKFDDATTNARIETLTEEATLNFDNPDKVRLAIDEQKSLLSKKVGRSDLRGDAMPPEAVQLKVLETSSKTHSAVIARMLTAGEYKVAKEYFGKSRSEITASDAAKLENAMERGTVVGESQVNASKIMTLHGADEKMALEAARQVKDPEIQKATVDEVKTRFAELKRIESGAREAAMIEASNIVEQSGNSRVVPPALWSQLSVSERAGLENRSRQIREGVQPVTNWSLYYDLKTKASSDLTRDQFLQENLMAMRSELADGEFKELAGLQTSMRRGQDEATRKELDGFRSKTQIVNDALRTIGVNPTPKPGKPEAEKVATFRNLVEQEVREIQRRTGKPASNEDVQKITDGLIIKVATPNATLPLFNLPIPFTGGEARAFEFLATKKSDIPKPEITRIEDALRRARLPVTDDSVVSTWNLRVGRRVRAGQ